MVGFDAEQNHHYQLFTLGSEVEVCTHEDGFKGAWFRATVVEFHASSSSSKKKKVLVEYKSLVTEEKSEPLKEYVSTVCLRPLPPEIEEKDFKEGLVIDANDRDGWWTGVVNKVLENSRYSVFFESPPHFIVFERSKLRVHQDWLNDQWVRPNKMEVSGALYLQERLEIACNNTNNTKTDIQPLSSVYRKDGTQSKLSCSTGSRKSLMKQPSHCDDLILLAFPSSKKKTSIPDLNGNATRSRPSKKLSEENAEAPLAKAAGQVSNIQNKRTANKVSRGVASRTSGQKGRRWSIKPVDLSQPAGKTESPFGKKRGRPKKQQSGELHNQGIKPEESKGWPNEQVKSPGKTPLGPEFKTNESAEDKIMNGKGIVKAYERSWRAVDSPIEQNGHKKDLNDQSEDKSLESKQLQLGWTCHKRKRGRPRKVVIVNQEDLEGGNEQNRVGCVADKMVFKGCTSSEGALPLVSVMQTSDLQDAQRKNNDEQFGKITKELEVSHSRISNNVDDDNQPLSKWCGEMLRVTESRQSPGRTFSPWNVTCEQVNIVKTPSVNSINNIVNNENGLPFIKTSRVWEVIESMEIFRTMPQTPHFRPLGTCKEEYREGLAIGIMVTFSGLVEKISKLQLDDPRHVFDSTLESLQDLEKHGFNVTILCCHVNELLYTKDKQGKFLDESTDAQSKILENAREKMKLVEEMEDIEKKIEELGDKRASVNSELEIKDIEIARLQSRVKDINECIQSTRHDFEKLVAAPLKLV